MDDLRINVANDFSVTPGPRWIIEGEYSGEKFNKEIFFPLLKSNEGEQKRIVIDLDNVAGYATSFLDEVFGKAVEQFGYDYISSVIEIKSDEEPYLIADIRGYMLDAKNKK